MHISTIRGFLIGVAGTLGCLYLVRSAMKGSTAALLLSDFDRAGAVMRRSGIVTIPIRPHPYWESLKPKPGPKYSQLATAQRLGDIRREIQRQSGMLLSEDGSSISVHG